MNGREALMDSRPHGCICPNRDTLVGNCPVHSAHVRAANPVEHGWRLDGLSPEQAKKGERILMRLNDWLAETLVGELMLKDHRQALGALAVECRRVARNAGEHS